MASPEGNAHPKLFPIPVSRSIQLTLLDTIVSSAVARKREGMLLPSCVALAYVDHYWRGGLELSPTLGSLPNLSLWTISSPILYNLLNIK